ncbi:hypothetical protein OHA71_23670 [Streptomyces sp. NBC_00444]|uniref:hypothetical protein n=1 Tax=Streptomyces sp. NBC_00444 TaxID=2975744 RepID=UPI002E2396C2
MRITRLTPMQARAVSGQLARITLFVRQVLDAFAALARSVAEAIQPLARLGEQLRAEGSYRPEWGNHLELAPRRHR